MSSIKYLVKTRKNPLNSSIKYYACSAPQELVTEAEMISQITQKTTVNRADVLAVLAALQEEIRFNLANGRKVKLNDIGTFRSSIRSMGTELEQDLTASCIKGCRVVFTPSRTIMQAIKPGTVGISFVSLSAPAESAPKAPQENL